MNRTLRRPMFRMGGSTEGITSGLAPRQGYANNNAADQRVRQAPRTGMRDFLINFGLDLASRPPSGSIFSTAAAAAKDPFKQYQAGRAAREQRDYERQWEQEGRDIQVEQFGQKLEQDRYLGELAAQGEKQFLETQIDNYWDPIIEAETNPTKKKQLEKEKAGEKYKIIVQGFDVSDQYKILTNEAAYSQALTAAESELGNTPNPKTKANWAEGDTGYQEKLQALINKYLRLAAQFLEEQEREEGATGGRIGYQNAGAVGEGQNVLQGEGAAVQEDTNQVNISYEQLRERLPQEISNEIVLLLSQSYEAFADFAEIQTQADVNEFNTKYNVQLFLPKQAGA
jgi:hypothetical protein